MLCLTRRALMERSRTMLETNFKSHSAAANPATDSSVTGKVKAELKKMIKIQLVLIPICVVFMVWMYPTPTEEDERRMRLEYERNAGWKT
ncbi:conserved hypothetical protein [Leishmania major strain Friedlin]|uniref:Uncharacterized protein n=1 Tax=Leishmania major TaxID=5664 RepID=Q4Q2Q2_LEIMA|nr:conserved hypothetical protein [Leishmania major strain Friedlin]CAG9582169.1 hypothetical_protein_-_conserved [Leishmania major strain Friedlin]CAJ08013.1 conserved hypothetical protein [Leishmania major strain Friedlin]|eukprot:XP_001686396.1 conserved hypothetical protein [Leishmania major strain Friedlin]